MDDLGVEGGAGLIECSSVQKGVLFVGLGVYSESSFIAKAFQLSALFFEFV